MLFVHIICLMFYLYFTKIYFLFTKVSKTVVCLTHLKNQWILQLISVCAEGTIVYPEPSAKPPR